MHGIEEKKVKLICVVLLVAALSCLAMVTLDDIVTHQALAQEKMQYDTILVNTQAFLNENSKADISRTQCLLYKILPASYHSKIYQLKEGKWSK